ESADLAGTEAPGPPRATQLSPERRERHGRTDEAAATATAARGPPRENAKPGASEIHGDAPGRGGRRGPLRPAARSHRAIVARIGSDRVGHAWRGRPTAARRSVSGPGGPAPLRAGSDASRRR